MSKVDETLRALAHPARRAMLQLVWDAEQSSSGIAERVGMSRPAASQHLKVLREAGLVHVRVDGNQRLYRVDLERLAQLTVGHSGAELANLLNEAAILAVQDDSPRIHARHIEAARDKILLGRVRAGVVVTAAERRDVDRLTRLAGVRATNTEVRPGDAALVRRPRLARLLRIANCAQRGRTALVCRAGRRRPAWRARGGGRDRG